MVLPEEDAELLGQMISADMCPKLEALSLSELRPVPLHPFWQYLQDSKTIHTLNWLSRPSELRCCPRRWALEQRGNYMRRLPRTIPRDKFLAGFRFTNLHHVQLQGLVRLTSAEQLRFLCQCPEVKTMTWHASPLNYPSETAKVLLQTTAWLHLHSLEIGIRELKDEDLKLTLDTIGVAGIEGCLQRLTVTMNVAAIKAFDSLRRHFRSLRSLNLERGLTSPMAQEIMLSCLELESITGKYILAEDILKGQPWVCRRLRTFHLRVLVSSTSALVPPSNQESGQDLGQERAAKLHHGIDRMVFERFASLPCLQQLLMMPSSLQYCLPGYRDSGRPLRWSIDAGLDQLAGLTHMREVSLDSESKLETEDLLWMHELWPRFEMV